MPGRKALAKIHIAKKELGLQEGDYRDLLQSRYGMSSAAELSNGQAADLIDHLRRRGWQPRPSPRTEGSATFRQQRMIRALWHRLEESGILHHPGPDGLRRFVAHMTGRQELTRLSRREASGVIEGLKRWLARTAADPGDKE